MFVSSLTLRDLVHRKNEQSNKKTAQRKTQKHTRIQTCNAREGRSKERNQERNEGAHLLHVAVEHLVSVAIVEQLLEQGAALVLAVDENQGLAGLGAT